MKYQKYILLFLSFSFLSFSSTGRYSKPPTTVCQETFHFFFLSNGEYPTFWIGIDVSGECISSRLFQININNSTVSVSSSKLKEYNNWGFIPELSSQFKKYEEQNLELKDSTWICEDFEISSPKYDAVLAKEFNGHILNGGGNAITWYQEKGKYGLQLPQIEGLKTELLFRYKRGLYFNYKISEVHYFPNKYILVFTHQPRLAVGDDSMHGFFIFKIIKGP